MWLAVISELDGIHVYGLTTKTQPLKQVDVMKELFKNKDIIVRSVTRLLYMATGMIIGFRLFYGLLFLFWASHSHYSPNRCVSFY